MRILQTIYLILQLVPDLVRAIKKIEAAHAERVNWQKRREIQRDVREAFKRAQETRDTSELEALVRRIGS